MLCTACTIHIYEPLCQDSIHCFKFSLIKPNLIKMLRKYQKITTERNIAGTIRFFY